MRNLGLTMLFLAACAPQLEDDEAAQVRQQVDGQGGVPGPLVCKTVNVSGHVFYNDLRTYGRFADRRAPIFGVTGGPDPYATSNDKQNYLGLYDGTVQIYEIDGLTGGGCSPSEYVAQVRIQADGSWSYSGEVCDMCRDNEGPNDTQVSVAAKIVLSNCFDSTKRCFSVADPVDTYSGGHFDDNWSGTDWSRWYRTAGLYNPVRIGNSTARDFGYDFFQTTNGLVAGDPNDQSAQAANVFASLVDVTRQVHVVHGVEFDYARWGKITGYYPSNSGGAGHSHQDDSDRFCVGLSPGEWQSGKTPAHEYGHLLNYWAWAKTGPWAGVGKWSSYCYDSDGDGTVNGDECDESSGQREYAANAFKEGWADFIWLMSFTGGGATSGTCQTRDGNTPTADTFTDSTGAKVCTANQTCRQGRHFYGDVSYALCDLWDSYVDTRDNATDRLAVPLTDMIDGLEDMFAQAGADEAAMAYATQTNPVTTSSLSICSFSDALVSTTVTPMQVAETIGVTHLDCGGTWLYTTTSAPYLP